MGCIALLHCESLTHTNTTASHASATRAWIMRWLLM
ncbi:hypothetical protein KSS87_003214 [Heliosperma pusillum]|nr:hypothetical protein KSS87_003214 [Heliosperma pusillum]